MTQTFRSRLRNRDLLYGTMVSLPSPEIAELMALVGFDWLFIDAEHGAFDTTMCQQMIQAVGNRAACLVRVPSGRHVEIKKMLDVGAAGIIAPQVNNAEQAKAVVAASKYPPEGNRGVGISRAHGYGVTFGEYVSTANEAVSVVIQAEHIEAVNNIEAITAVSGLDAVFVGPYDLSASMGKIGQLTDPELLEAIAHVRQTCQNANIALGFFGLTAESLLPYIEQGYTLLTVGTDSVFLANGASNALSKVQQVI